MLTYAIGIIPRALYAYATADGARVSRIRRRVRVRELDMNLHMNQAVYPHILELGRTHLFFNSGAWLAWRRAGVNPMVADQTLTYRRELKPFTTYEIDTRVVGTDGRFLVVQGHVIVGDRVHTKVEARLLFVGPDGVLDAAALEPHATPWITDALPVQDWRLVPT